MDIIIFAATFLTDFSEFCCIEILTALMLGAPECNVLKNNKRGIHDMFCAFPQQIHFDGQCSLLFNQTLNSQDIYLSYVVVRSISSLSNQHLWPILQVPFH
jgi:hypothetical protein